MSIQFEISDANVRVSVDEIDRHTLSEFAAELADGLSRYEEARRADPDRCPPSMVVDLGGVEFLDSSGVRALLDSDFAALRFGGRVTIVGAHGAVRRCLRVTGVLDRMQDPAERRADR